MVGIIGRNGAGKSTLLKILSRITEPTGGRIHLKGRVASLLEVGTGFHPEFTGRENIFLNGAILGMTRPRSERKFDEIVAFAEVEKFLDTPGKTLFERNVCPACFRCRGASWSRKFCLSMRCWRWAMRRFRGSAWARWGTWPAEGRTVLFVSHNMQAISTLTRRCIVLSKARAP